MSEDYRITTENKVKTEMKILGNVFSSVRLLSEDEVGARTKNCESKRVVGDCFEVWNRRSACRNCISYRALTEKRQFTKIEKTKEGVFQVIADYREVDGKPCVMEMIRGFDGNMIVDYADEDGYAEPLAKYFDKTYTDVLTETYNRRYYEEFLAGEELNGGIAMIDLDDFKLYNDLFGHGVGDAVLKAVAATVKSCVRFTDKVVRYGGDEFLIVVPGVKEEAFKRCLSDICDSVKETVVDDYPAIKPSVSAGGIICRGETIKNAVVKADEFMYIAKQKKDCVITEIKRNDKPDDLIPRKKRVLIVDDSLLNREILSGILKNEFEIIEAESGEEATAQIERYGADISVVLLDLIMPGMSGFGVLDYMNERGLMSDIPVITITGDESNDSMRLAYEKGVSDYITRPFDAKIVYRRVSNTINVYSKQKQLLSEIKREMRVNDKNRTMIVEILSQIVEHPEEDGGGTHAGHMTEFTRLILERYVTKKEAYGVKSDEIYAISTAAALHDIGKARIDRKIVDKKGKLTPEEFETMKNHTLLGEKMLLNIKVFEKEPLIKYAREICRYHHERFDGKGYPDGLKGNEIPISAQVVSVCDVYDALISKRSYKPSYSHEKAMEMIKNGECGAFNPLILECLGECSENFKKIASKENLPDE